MAVDVSTAHEPHDEPPAIAAARFVAEIFVLTVSIP
jgi:hypothetical protein